MVTVFESNILLFIYRQEKIAERYYWKGMTKDVAEYCGTCLVYVSKEEQNSQEDCSRSIVRCSCLLSNGADRISNQMARGALHT